MVYPLDSTSEADLLSGRFGSCDLVDFYTKDPESGEAAFLRAWNWPGDCSYPANDPPEVDGAVGAKTRAAIKDIERTTQRYACIVKRREIGKEDCQLAPRHAGTALHSVRLLEANGRLATCGKDPNCSIMRVGLEEAAAHLTCRGQG